MQDNPHPGWLVLIGALLLLLGVYARRDPLWHYHWFDRWVNPWEDTKIDGRWEVEHQDLVLIAHVNVGCIFFFGLIFASCGLLGLLTMHK